MKEEIKQIINFIKPYTIGGKLTILCDDRIPILYIGSNSKHTKWRASVFVCEDVCFELKSSNINDKIIELEEYLSSIGINNYQISEHIKYVNSYREVDYYEVKKNDGSFKIEKF